MAYNALIEHSINELPLEACGLLVSKIGEMDRICLVVPMRNLSKKDKKVTYLINPKDLVETELKLESKNLESIGVYHSHPHHPAFPSETDLKNAYSNWLYFIVKVTELKQTDVKAWMLQNGKFVEMKFLILPK